MKHFFFLLSLIISITFVKPGGAQDISSLPRNGNTHPLVSHRAPLQVVRTAPDFLILRFRLPNYAIQKQLHNGQEVTHIRLEGASWTTDTGKPRLPIYTSQIGLPPTNHVAATVLEKQTTFKNVRALQLAPPDPRFPDAPTETAAGPFYPTALLEVVPVGYVREQRIGILRIHPIQYNTKTQQLRITHDLTFRIDFYGVPSQGTVSDRQWESSNFPPNGGAATYQNIFRTSLINNTQAAAWRQAVFANGRGNLALDANVPRAPAVQTVSRRRFKTPITRSDMYYISYNNLKAAGVDSPETIDLNSILIKTGGDEVGYYILDQNQNQTFDPSDKIIFYGRARITKFTNVNYYWLSFTHKGAASTVGSPEEDRVFRVNTRSATPQTQDLVVPTSFLAKKRFEEDVHHNPLTGVDVRSDVADHYFWTGFRGDNSKESRKKFGFVLPGAVSRFTIDRNAILSIKLQGASRRGVARHKAKFYINGNAFGETEWTRQAFQIAVRDIPQKFIHHNLENSLQIDALDKNKTPEGNFDFYLDWYEFEYWHDFRARNNRLFFNTNTDPRISTEIRHYRVTDFSTAAIDVYTLEGNGSLTAKLVDGEVKRSGSTYSILFEDKPAKGAGYVAIANNAYRQVGALTEIPPTPLLSPATQADYIVISHKTFLDSIQPLVDFRKAQGLTVQVVDVDDIYNEFSGGIFTPFAIQKFLQYAYHTWQHPIPSYVLLVGDAHYDYKGITAKHFARNPNYNIYPIFVPTYHGWAPESGETAMDQRFVNVSGDDALPDMHIGRLSVQTPAELTQMVRKIINYEKNQQLGPWQATLVQVADDDSDNPGDVLFENSRNKLIQEVIPLAYNTKQLYLGKIDDAGKTRSLIRTAINQGTLVIEYAGHGGSETWADESIFRIEDVDVLQNRHLPFVITTTCLNGEFDKPRQFGRHSLSEQFLHSPKGAIASLSASRLTYATANAEFDTDLFTAMFAKTSNAPGHNAPAAVQPSIGQIVTDAKIRFISRISNQQWIPGTEQYILLGDPATKLACPTLDITVELEHIALNSSKDIVVTANEIGAFGPDGRFWKAEDFSTEIVEAVAIFQNHFDDTFGNEIVRRRSGSIWQGEYNTIRLDVPNTAVPGRGVVRVFAHDKERTAIGGAPFWIDTPIIPEVLEELDVTKTDTLNITALVLDDLGAAQGIRNIEVVWDSTVQLDAQTYAMVKTTAPSRNQELLPTPPNGQWYQLQTPIPLPKGGGKVRYRIGVTDSTGLEVKYPSANQRSVVDVPEGPNIAIRTDATQGAPIRYIFNPETEKYALVAFLINNGGRTVKSEVEIVFAEGDPDFQGDLQIDEDADIIGTVTLHPSDWQSEGDTVLQSATAELVLQEALATGAHRIYVIADPDVDLSDDIRGNISEPREYDNKQFISFVVNEFYYTSSEPLTASSLDRVFDIHFPVEAVATGGQQRVPLSISTSAPLPLTQPALTFAPIPRVAALRRGRQRTDAPGVQHYEAIFRTANATLKKPARVKLRFDINGLEDAVKEKTPWATEGSQEYKDALIAEAEKLAIYAWQPNYKKWRRLPSDIHYVTPDETSEENTVFQLDNYVTPTQADNASEQTVLTEHIKIDASFAPAATWVILFLDESRYEIFFKRKRDIDTITKVGEIGQLDTVFREEGYGLELQISTPSEGRPFEFADILVFKTDYDEGKAYLVEIRNQNEGNGTASITARLGLKQTFQTGDWFLFFTSEQHYEIWDHTGTPVRLPNVTNTKVVGVVNKPLFLSHIGLEILVTGGSEPFHFGDKMKFSTANVATISADVTELTPFTLINSEDTEPPDFKLWVDGIQPQDGSVIPPRPLISLLLQDANGIDLDTLAIRRGDNGNPLVPVTDYTRRNTDDTNTIPIDYKPIFFPGEYVFEIEVRDFNGNAIGGKAEVVKTRFSVIQNPDITSPVIDIIVNDTKIEMGVIENATHITKQPRCEIRVADDIALDDTLLNIRFNRVSDNTAADENMRRYREFDEAKWELISDKAGVPQNANINFAPDLSNGTYQIHVTATDTSENTTDVTATFTLQEAVTLREVFNVPNPVETGSTFFTYHLAQMSDSVTIKIYTVNGRLIRTIKDASANRGTNETRWDCRDETGTRCANGVYLYRVIADTEDGSVQKVGKLAILR